MVGVAQLVEHLVVVQEVAGSSPVTHPSFFGQVVMMTYLLARLLIVLAGRRQATATAGSAEGLIAQRR